LAFGLFLTVPAGRSLADDVDSLQFRVYHGLDEIGSGSTFYLDVEPSGFRSTVKGQLDALYRRPPGSQGDLKTTGYFEAIIGRSLRRNFDLEAIFHNDFYRFERFRGPPPLNLGFPVQPETWDMQSPTVTSSGVLQQIDRSMLGIGGSFKPDSLLVLTSIIGQQWENREGFDDEGLSASLEAQLDGFEYKGYRNDLDFYFEQEELGARMNRDLRFGYGLDKEFSGNSSDRLEVFYHQKKYDYHIGGTQSIGTRTDTQQRLRNQLRYDPLQDWELYVDTELIGSRHEDRTATASTVREKVNTTNALTLYGEYADLQGWTSLQVDWGAQEDATGLKRDRGTSLEANLSWTPTQADSIAFLSAIRKRQYDTSDTANYDDRDRLRYEIDLHYGHRFSPYFHFATRAQTTLEHLVYIFGQKSDQNHWNRIFRLKPEVLFAPHADWENIAGFEIVANMTDYDFELDPSFIKSTIYRRYTASDQLSWDVSRGWALNLLFVLDLEDNGRLLWDEWIEQISEEYRTYQATLVLVRQTQSGIHFDIGMSAYERKGWEYELDPEYGTVKSPFFYLTRWGPLLQLSYPSASGVSIVADGDLSWVRETNSDDYTIVNLDLKITWR
jgi:hypothetical protein